MRAILRASVLVALFIPVGLKAQYKCLSGNCFNGYGTAVFPSGGKYIGDFLEGKIHGKGIFYFSDGNKYIGNWHDQYREGDGRFVFANGDEYFGEFHLNKFSGRGVMKYANGNRYEGEWQENWQHGQGIFVFVNGDRYEGQFVMGYFEGSGRMDYADGSRYEGQWYKGKRQGQGALYYADGRQMAGQWTNDSLDDETESVKSVEVAFEKVDKDPKVKIWAVIVGAARYIHMPVLRYTDDDAYQIYAFLKSPEGGALPDNQVKVLIDEDATRKNVISTMRMVFSRADDNDVVMLYFSGHGLPGAFLPIDFDGYNNKLTHVEIKDVLRQSRAKHKLVIADACHSGTLFAAKTPLESTLKKYYQAFEDAKGGMALLMSSKGEEYSLEDGGLRAGIFSHFLVRGLKGEADTNVDNLVTIKELFVFIHRQVRLYTANAQTPSLSGNYDEGMPVGVVR